MSKSNTNKAVVVLPGREASLRNRHPWIFSGSIDKKIGQPAAGDVVEVRTREGKVLAAGHYGTESIAVRVLAWEPWNSVTELLEGKFASAWNMRKVLGLTQCKATDAFRVINAEGDGLPGLVIDLYHRTAVVQMHSAGMQAWSEEIASALRAVLGERLDAIIDRSPELTSGICLWSRDAAADAGLTEIKENELRFEVDCLRGQKTGFYLDQRTNREAVARYAAGKTVLNAFCYSGGFTIYAMRAGAKSVCSVDASPSAIAAVKKNIELNGLNIPQREDAADCMEYLKSLDAKYDLIVLDPPAFVKHQGALRGGITGYETINYQAMRQIAAGGVIATFSCSQFISRELFHKVLFKAAQRSGRNVSVLEELSQAPCHPVSIYHPEGLYLKGLILYVE